MSILKQLREAKSLRDIAELLRYKTSALSFILYKMSAANKYKTFEIPKRNKGTRKICAPNEELKLLQGRLANLLQNCINEINTFNNFKDQISHGFKPNRSIKTNARQHRNKRYVFNIDIENFFGTINFGRVRGFFIKDKNFALHEKVATIISQIACHEGALPQGSPCSPIISNLIGHVLDIHLVKLAAKNGCIYTRYADDLTFSTNLKKFPEQIATRVNSPPHTWETGNELNKIISKSGFSLNPKKTRMQYHDSRQEVTGLVVNRKINVRNEYRHTVRAMVHRLFTTGNFDFEYTKDGAKTPGNINQLHGMLGFINNIDIYNNEKQIEKTNTFKKETTYRRFLIYKNFYATQIPVIICEGKTDNIYLLHAIRQLANEYPQLATKNPDGSTQLKIRFFKYAENSTNRILGITGGGPCLAKFIHTYRSEIARFNAPGKQHPVIMLVDNDSGSDSLFSVAKELTKQKPTRLEPFIHLIGNLYLLPTPRLPGDKPSSIEDFFTQETKSTIISGKTFSPKKDMETDTHYGKAIFAHKVVHPNAENIDFSGFKKILFNLSSVITEHSKIFPT